MLCSFYGQGPIRMACVHPQNNMALLLSQLDNLVVNLCGKPRPACERDSDWLGKEQRPAKTRPTLARIKTARMGHPNAFLK